MRVWLGLLPGGDAPERLVERALASGCALDVSSAPSLWGSHLRGKDAKVCVFGGSEAQFASGRVRAQRLVEAHLVETLSAVGCGKLEAYFLCVDPLNDEQRAGALDALALAKEDGSVAQVGTYSVRGTASDLSCGPLNPITGLDVRPQVACRTLNWKYGVPFCVLPGPWKLRNLTLSFYGMSVAQAVLSRALSSGEVLVGVRTVQEIEEALAAQEMTPPDGLDSMLREFAAAYDDETNWRELVEDDRTWLSEAAQRRVRDAS